MTTNTALTEERVRKCIEVNYVPITEEGSVSLAMAILRTAYKDYVDSLTRVMKAWEAKENKRTDRNLGNWVTAIRLKHANEKFYYSELFTILTLGLSAPGNDVIMKMQRKLKYDPYIYEK